jgi:hypothetical protein
MFPGSSADYAEPSGDDEDVQQPFPFWPIEPLEPLQVEIAVLTVIIAPEVSSYDARPKTYTDG